MVDSSDAHLESALSEYNDRVNELESDGDPLQLLEAYVNRGCILYMMEYRTSAMEDLDSADGIIRDLEAEGMDVDAGTFVKTYVTMGDLLFDQEGDPVESYARAAIRLGELDEGCRHFDHRSIVRMCIHVIENLIDSEYPEDTEPFFAKAMSLVLTKQDSWSLNRRLELHNLEGETADSLNDPQGSIDAYAKAIDVGTELLERAQLDDSEELVLSFVSKSEAEEGIGLLDMYIADMTAAITLMEQMLEYNRLDDTDVLVSLHHDLAGVLIKEGRIEDAEKHLMKAMSIGVRGANDYIRDQTDRSV